MNDYISEVDRAYNMRQDQPDKAVAELRRLASAHPEAPAAYMKLGMTLWQMSKQEEAKTYFRKTIGMFGGVDNLPPPMKTTLAQYGVLE